MYRNVIKPFFDFVTALTGFIILMPVFLFLLLILLASGVSKPFFIQKRPGRDGRIFSIIKFKTMTDQRDKSGTLLPDDKRLTTIGKFMRATSLDEIPQLINVIEGDMSLVGPRPLLPEYLPLYNNFQKQRHMVTPGITGWAQVNGRNAISWDDKFSLDVHYVKNQSFILDLQILMKTVKKVFLRSGVTAKDSQTATRFKGNL